MSDDTRPEFAYINWLRGQKNSKDTDILIGLGDDCAAIQSPRDRITLLTTDMLMEGSCFILAEAGARRVGRKAMSVNLSDIAAMAGIPRHALVSLGLPRGQGRRIAEELYLGMREVADAFETRIIGGDTNSWDGPLVVSVTLLGEAQGRGPVKRSGAKTGDWIFVTGELGGSILGKHLDFTPRVREAGKLHQLVDLHAMIDISDGFASDLQHICKESGCGALIRGESIPISASARIKSAQDGKPALEHALGDGEDFELIFTVSPEDGERLKTGQTIEGTAIHHVGEILEEGLWLEIAGKRRELACLGYGHEI
jgi:thiamine-monophosphate kinase